MQKSSYTALICSMILTYKLFLVQMSDVEDLFTHHPAHPKGGLSDKSLKQHMEFDVNPLLHSPSGMFFRERIIEAGLVLRLGSNRMVCKKEYVRAFKDHVKLENGVLVLRLSKNRVQPLSREFIGQVTGLLPNPNYQMGIMEQYEDARLFSTPLREPTSLLFEVAPYHHVSHRKPNLNVLQTSGLQENQVLIAKWFTTNFLGLENRHNLSGKAAWFLKHLSDGDLLRVGWCPCAAIVSSLHHARHKGGVPLSCLLTFIWARVRRLDLNNPDFTCIAQTS